MSLNGQECGLKLAAMSYLHSGRLMRVIHASRWSMASVSGRTAGGERRGRDRATRRAAEGREAREGSGNVRNADEQSRRGIRFGWLAPAFVSVDWSLFIRGWIQEKICGSTLQISNIVIPRFFPSRGTCTCTKTARSLRRRGSGP